MTRRYRTRTGQIVEWPGHPALPARLGWRLIERGRIDTDDRR